MYLKKILFLMVVLVMFVFCTTSVIASSFDINKDGDYNIRDVTALQKYLLKYNVQVDENSIDVNDDGKININDATYIQRDLVNFEVNSYDNCTLIVNGKDLSNHCCAKFSKYTGYARLPLLAISEALDAEIQWYTDEIVYIIFENEKYILNIVEETLVKEDDIYQINLLIVPDGGPSHHFETINNEVVLDNVTLRCGFLPAIGAFIDIDYEQAIIIIQTVEYELNNPK